MGVVLYIMLSGKVPFPGRNEIEIIGNVIKGEYHFNHDAFKTVSSEAKEMIKHLLMKDVSQRFSAEQALSHIWITKFSSMGETGNTLSNEAYDEMKEVLDDMRTKKAVLTYLAAKIPERNF